MNICRPGNCICDAREWEGDTNCMGEIDCKVCGREHLPRKCDENEQPSTDCDPWSGRLCEYHDRERLEGGA